MVQKYVLEMEPMKQPVYFTIEGSKIEELFNLMAQPYLLKCCNNIHSEGRSFNIFENKNGNIKIESNNVKFYIKPEQIAFGLQKLLAENIILKEGYYFAHGAIISYCGKGILLLGKSGSGKSTLTAYLCSNGFQYVSDDKAIISSVTDKVYPFSRFIQLREDALNILKQYHIVLKTKDISIYEYNRKSVIDIIPQKVVLLLRHNNIDECILQRKKGNDAMQALLWNSYSANCIHDTIHSAISFARKKQVYFLEYNRMDETGKLLERVCQ